MISKLLDGRCTYTPTDDMLTVTRLLCVLLTSTVEYTSMFWPPLVLCDAQLSKLRLYLPRMQPSSLLHTIVNSASRSNQSNLDEQVNLLCFSFTWTHFHSFLTDHVHHPTQAYYFCYSLLTLVKEASNFLSCPPEQKVWCLFFHRLFFSLKIFTTVCLVCFVPWPFILSGLIFIAFRKSCCVCALSWKRMWSVTFEKVRNVFTGPGSVRERETFLQTLAHFLFLNCACCCRFFALWNQGTLCNKHYETHTYTYKMVIVCFRSIIHSQEWFTLECITNAQYGTYRIVI